MSKLKELIDRLCPNGVPYEKFGDVLEFRRGQTITEKDSTPGEYPVIAGGQKPAYFHDVYNRNGETIAVAGSGAYAGFVSWWTTPIFLSDAFSVHPKDDKLLPKYVYYYMVNMQQQIHNTKKGSGVPHVHGSSIAKFTIPIPPIEVQEEIVKILDRFADYAAELQAELQARKEQYEYYRNLLLTFNPSACGCGTDDKQEIKVTCWGGCNYEIAWKTMGEICDIKGRIGFRGYTRKDIVPKGQGAISLSPSNIINGSLSIDNSTYISWDKYNESPEIMVENDDIIFAKTASVGKTTIIRNLKEKATINPQLVVLKRIKCNPRYLSFLLNGSCFQTEVKKITGVGSVPNVPQSSLAKIKLPIPPIELQNKIVAILDRFETLVNDLTQGLPAEIAAVKEQYEYYRNKLLTFKQIV